LSTRGWMISHISFENSIFGCQNKASDAFSSR
jgi:hypothetical protein